MKFLEYLLLLSQFTLFLFSEFPISCLTQSPYHSPSAASLRPSDIGGKQRGSGDVLKKVMTLVSMKLKRQKTLGGQRNATKPYGYSRPRNHEIDNNNLYYRNPSQHVQTLQNHNIQTAMASHGYPEPSNHAAHLSNRGGNVGLYPHTPSGLPGRPNSVYSSLGGNESTRADSGRSRRGGSNRDNVKFRGRRRDSLEEMEQRMAQATANAKQIQSELTSHRERTNRLREQALVLQRS
eukprot:GHVQ01024934.1.p1 GENE.GHVQ01024934.1~~GHVQ01024934.1.p1  ORF type:complete len:236 (+),score=28.25 GHVQ01024934.1:553-1260(+)